MLRFLLIRLLGMIVVLWVLVTIVFMMGSVIPQDPARAYAGAGASKQVIAEKRKELGLDDPILTQYGHYLDKLAHGDLSESVHTRRPVMDDLRDALPPTLELLFASILITMGIGLLVGVVTSSNRRGSAAIRGVLISGASVPTFTLGLVALFLLYYKLGWFPAGGQSSQIPPAVDGPTNFLLIDSLLAGNISAFGDAIWHLILPATVLALTPALLTARALRSSLQNTMRQDYVRTAQAKGLTQGRVLRRHALRNSLNAPLTIAGLELGGMLAGIAVVETIFAWPGLGLYIDRSIASTDVPAISGATLVIGIVFILANLVVDLVQMAVDPRLRQLA